MTNQILITRKELSMICGLSYDRIRRNETRFGLDAAAVRYSKRGLLYKRDKAVAALIKVGVM